MISVIVPTRGRPRLLRRALASVASQGFGDYEIVVVDDGGGEGAAVAETVPGARSLLTGGAGQVAARRLGVEAARGEVIAFLDDDDWWAEDGHLAALAATLGAGGGLAYASGRIEMEGEDGTSLGSLPFQACADASSLRRDNLLIVSGIAYERSLHERLGAFDERLAFYWDWDWYLRLAASGARFADTGGKGVRVSARPGTVSSAENEAARRDDLARLCSKHRLQHVVLRNHASIAVDQAEAARAVEQPAGTRVRRCDERGASRWRRR